MIFASPPKLRTHATNSRGSSTANVSSHEPSGNVTRFISAGQRRASTSPARGGVKRTTIAMMRPRRPSSVDAWPAM